MDDVCKSQVFQKGADEAATAALPAPTIPLLDGDSLDLDKLGSEDLKTYINYPGLALGHVISARFFGCGAAGEIFDRDPTAQVVERLEPDGSFLVEVDNALLKGLDKGVAFYSYAVISRFKEASTLRHVEETSTRLLFYINKQVEPALSVPLPHFVDSDGLEIDLSRVTGDGQVITSNYPFMAVNDKVVLSWKDEYGYSETFTKPLIKEDLDEPLVWRIDSANLLMAGAWCELAYSIQYESGGESHSPVQRFAIVTSGSGQLPSLPAPEVPGHSGGMLDPSQYLQGLPVTVEDYGAQVGDELLLTAAGKRASLATLRVDSSIMDSGRLHFKVPADWLQQHVGEPVKLTWQWARLGAAADSLPLDLVLRKPLDLKVPFVENATSKDPENDEEVDPDMVQFGFMFPDRLRQGAYAQVPVESDTGNGKITMHWEGFGTTGKYSTDTPTAGNNLRFQIPSTAVPANFGRRVKVFYTVEDAEGVTQPSPAYGLKVEKLTATDFEAVQCPHYPTGNISLSRVTTSVTFELSSNSWRFFAVGQQVRVYVKGRAKPGGPSLPDEVIRDDVPVSEDEWFNDELKMDLGKAYLEKLELNTAFNVYVEVSFDEGVTFVPGKSAEFNLVP
ncbi:MULTISPECIES: hypothetical protein [Pseudomonas]|uniref:Uncharacterized protein n=1 Tax=Pseudomonas putida S13.1.2 TaxID=1384061 RepID=A0AAU8S9Q1_PSEPU|nr:MULTISPECIES: hypothetical protein [Pseudomonas]AJQ48466.1 hypothetical protein N805_15150 [Pseudomonas putida S13.1.2]